MPNTWIQALRTYNKRHNNKFCIPKKNTDEFAKVKKLQKKQEQFNKIKITPIYNNQVKWYKNDINN